MGHTVASVAKRLQKLEDRMAAIEQEMDEALTRLDDKDKAKAFDPDSQAKDMRWLPFVTYEEYRPVENDTECPYVCEVTNCLREDGSEFDAHWHIEDGLEDSVNEGIHIPNFICSECFFALLDQNR